MSVTHLLHESAVGYAVLKVIAEPDAIATNLKESKKAFSDFGLFGKTVQVVNFSPFTDAAQALENANTVSEGLLSDYLQIILQESLPKPGKKSKVVLGVSDKIIAGSISTDLKIPCETAETSRAVAELLRGVREHASKLLKQTGQFKTGDIELAQLGLGHSYSRAKVKFSVNRNDNHIIQAIATLDALDKTTNQKSMRLREWYSWHFPELIKIVSDNATYAKLALFIGDKSSLSENMLHDLAALVNDDEGTATAILEAAKNSFGQDVSADDLKSMMDCADVAVKLHALRRSAANYLVRKMNLVAPNLAALNGEIVAARLIAHAGSLMNLSKMPASTVQILGAEKALFRALKTKGNTPKYGLIYHSSFIGRAGAKNKGRISRYLANKSSIAARCDSFRGDDVEGKNNARIGQALRKQVEDRLEFLSNGTVPMKNIDAMAAAVADGDDGLGDLDDIFHAGSAKKSVKSVDVDVEMSDGDDSDDDSEVDAAAAKASKKAAKAAKKAKKEEKKKRKAEKELKKLKKQKA